MDPTTLTHFLQASAPVVYSMVAQLLWVWTWCCATRSLGFSAKATLLTLCFLIPLAVVTVAWQAAPIWALLR